MNALTYQRGETFMQSMIAALLFAAFLGGLYVLLVAYGYVSNPGATPTHAPDIDSPRMHYAHAIPQRGMG